MKIDTRSIISNGIIAAVYVVLTYITYTISFLGLQFRFAEILVLLCFFLLSVIHLLLVLNFGSSLDNLSGYQLD